MIHLPGDKNPNELHPLALAYVGDAVYELYIRSHLIEKGVLRPNDLQKQAIPYVSAVGQASAYKQLQPQLTAEEDRIVKRGRNTKQSRTPKNVPISTYRNSTGLETLIGYLYLSQDKDRLQQIMQWITDRKDSE